MKKLPQKSYAHTLFLTIIALAISFISLASPARAQQGSPVKETILEDWPLESPVASFLGHTFQYPVKMSMKSGPVRVSCVRSSVTPYYHIDRIRIENGSTKPVVKLNLSWTLLMEGPPNTILESWETGLIDVGEILPGWPASEVPALKFQKALESPVEERGGSWMMVEVAVDEVVYKDGSRWKRK